MKRKLEERMDGHSSCVDGGNAGRCYNHNTLAGVLYNVPQECSLTSTCLTCQKHTLARLFHKLPGCLQLLILLHMHK